MASRNAYANTRSAAMRGAKRFKIAGILWLLLEPTYSPLQKIIHNADGESMARRAIERTTENKSIYFMYEYNMLLVYKQESICYSAVSSTSLRFPIRCAMFSASSGLQMPLQLKFSPIITPNTSFSRTRPHRTAFRTDEIASLLARAMSEADFRPG